MKVSNPDGWKSLGSAASLCTAILSGSWASRRLETIWRRAERFISRSGKAEAAGSAGIFMVVHMLFAVYV